MIQYLIKIINDCTFKLAALMEEDPCEQYERARNNLLRAAEYLEEKKSVVILDKIDSIKVIEDPSITADEVQIAPPTGKTVKVTRK